MVVSELRGEKIDIIPFNEEPARFVAKALSPARVREVLVDDDAKQATVIVPDDQLSLAIGKEGQNARLAARLTGWRVDIRSETEFAKEEAEMAYDEEEMSGRCAAILSNGKRCPNAAAAGLALLRPARPPGARAPGGRPGRRPSRTTSSGAADGERAPTTPRSRRAPTRSPPRPRPPRSPSSTRPRPDVTADGGEPADDASTSSEPADAVGRGRLDHPARRRVGHLADRGAGHRPASRGRGDRRGPGRGRRTASRRARVRAVRAAAEEPRSGARSGAASAAGARARRPSWSASCAPATGSCRTPSGACRGAAPTCARAPSAPTRRCAGAASSVPSGAP